MYPTLVVVLVNAQCSILDRSLENSKSGTLQFATTFPSGSDIDSTYSGRIVRDDHLEKVFNPAVVSSTSSSSGTTVVIHKPDSA